MNIKGFDRVWNHTPNTSGYRLLLVCFALLVAWGTAQFPTLAIIVLISLLVLGLFLAFFRIAICKPFTALTIILILIPFHTISENLLTLFTTSSSVSMVFSLWKELAIVLILVAVIVRRGGLPASIPKSILPFLIYALYGAFMIITAPALSIGIIEYRNLFEGLIILLAVFLIRPRPQQIFYVLDILVVEGVFLSIWGFFSRYILNFYTYLQTFRFIPPTMTETSLRFGSVFSISGSLFLRANSIFIGPNEFALYLAPLMVYLLAVLIFKYAKLSKLRRVAYIFALIVVSMGEFISISRNAWLLIAVAATVMFLLMRPSRGKIILFIIAITIGGATILLIPNLKEFILRTLNLMDTSAAGRVVLLKSGIESIIQHPMGIGLGNASYKFQQVLAERTHTEFYIFLVALELGWIGLILYLLTVARFAFRSYQLTKPHYPFDRRFLAVIAISLLSGTFVSQFTSAITTEWLFQLYLWLLVGSAVFISQEPTAKPENLKPLESRAIHD